MRPEGGTVKINFDAAFDEKTGKEAWGFVVRSSSGEFMAAGAGKLSHLQAETEACVVLRNLALEPMLNVLDGPMWLLRLYLIWWLVILLCTVVNGIPIKFKKKDWAFSFNRNGLVVIFFL
jgi:hypothetical protein